MKPIPLMDYIDQAFDMTSNLVLFISSNETIKVNAPFPIYNIKRVSYSENIGKYIYITNVRAYYYAYNLLYDSVFTKEGESYGLISVNKLFNGNIAPKTLIHYTGTSIEESCLSSPFEIANCLYNANIKKQEVLNKLGLLK